MTNVPPIDVLYEDNHLLVVNKRAQVATMGVAVDQASLVTDAKEYIRQKYSKPGNVYLGVVSRLDRLATGVIVLARTSKAAARLSEQFRDRKTEKTYLARIAGSLDPRHGVLEDFVRKDEPRQRMVTCSQGSAGAKHAILEYTSHADRAGTTRLQIQLQTGRKHQIRLQLASRGFPILGDRKYGSTRPFPSGIALHSQRLVIEHPTRREPMVFEAPLPPSWNG